MMRYRPLIEGCRYPAGNLFISVICFDLPVNSLLKTTSNSPLSSQKAYSSRVLCPERPKRLRIRPICQVDCLTLIQAVPYSKHSISPIVGETRERQWSTTVTKTRRPS